MEFLQTYPPFVPPFHIGKGGILSKKVIAGAFAPAITFFDQSPIPIFGVGEKWTLILCKDF